MRKALKPPPYEAGSTYCVSAHIEIIGLEVIERKFGDAAKIMIEILERFKHFNGDLFSDSIKIEIVSEKTRVLLK